MFVLFRFFLLCIVGPCDHLHGRGEGGWRLLCVSVILTCVFVYILDTLAKVYYLNYMK